MGEEISTEDGYESAKLAALRCISELRSVADLDKVRIVKVTGYVNSTADYGEQPKVVNGASELLGQLFGDAGVHARSAVGVSSLPLGACCEVELIVRLKP